MVLLALSMFPQIAIAGPVWRLLNFLDWLNTYHGIVAAYISLSLPFAVWVLTTFFQELPYDIEEAALIDGCTRWQALRLVVFPLAAPGLFTAAILVFIHAWNEFFFALIILTYPARQTLPVGIALFPGEYTMPWGEIAAASTIATTTNPEERRKAEAKFWMLYWGPLVVVETQEVSEAMQKFGNCLTGETKGDLCALSAELASACQSSVTQGANLRLVEFSKGKFDYRKLDEIDR